MTSNPPLYGAPRPSAVIHRSSKKDITSSTSLAFTTQLTSLLAQSASSAHSNTTSGRARPSKTKSDIFKTHNKGSKKRALADISSHDGSQKGTKQEIGGIDPSDLHRSKRKMEEKARLYASMKRGDYVPDKRAGAGGNAEEHSLVDFDRKWADAGEGSDGHSTSSGEDDDGANSETEEELVPYEDEFGRLRYIPLSQRTHLLAQRNALSHTAQELASYTARPSAPINIIRGDTIQSSAFNPDTTIAEQMDELARKRDKELTPPPETHYDASSEMRSKGVGFYQFSRDEGERRMEMEALERVRGETERVRREGEERKVEREREVEERRKVLKKKREEKLADRFLRGLG